MKDKSCQIIKKIDLALRNIHAALRFEFFFMNTEQVSSFVTDLIFSVCNEV
jgi:hypothetical protein